ncbi:hypothetical protein HY772_10495 [Candidatus Woesearchaeota archaeon]|nr:hypothetical protein [Candidatus Woesearchaeota archaeon]
MEVVVADACSLILLTKVTVLETLAGEVRLKIPAEVYSEAVTSGIARGYFDAMIIDALVKNGRISVEKVAKRTRLTAGLGKGEAEAIGLFLQLNADVLLTDNSRAIKTCKYLKIPFTISPRVVVSLCKKHKLPKEKGVKALEILRIEGRYSPLIITEALHELEVI